MPGGAPAGKRHAPNGAGSVYKETVHRKGGTSSIRWVGAITLEGGKRKRVTAPTQKAALAKLKVLVADQAQGKPAMNERQTVEQYLTWWLEHSLRIKPTSLVTYEVNVRLHIIPAIGKLQLGKLRPEHVEALISAMEKKGYAPATINLCRAVLRQALGVAVRRERIWRNAAALVDPVRLDRAEPEPLSAEECQTWLAALRVHPTLGTLFVAAIATGLRQGELIGLRWQDVELEHARLVVRQQYQRGAFTSLKTVGSQRGVPLPSFLVEALEAHRGRQVLERILAGPDWVDHDLVFPNPTGGPRNGAAVWAAFQRTLDSAGIERHPFHYLRHVYDSMLIALGVHEFVAMELMGHSEVRTTRRYSHVGEPAKIAAVDQIDALLRGIA